MEKNYKLKKMNYTDSKTNLQKWIDCYPFIQLRNIFLSSNFDELIWFTNIDQQNIHKSFLKDSLHIVLFGYLINNLFYHSEEYFQPPVLIFNQKN